MAIAPPKMTNGQIAACTQSGGSNLASTNRARPTTTKPRIRITKTAAPSPTSCACRSKPQDSQCSRTVRRPSKRRPWPQRGQRQNSPAWNGETCIPGRLTACPGMTSMDRQLRARRSPPVDGREQEQPDHVDEVPVPRRRLEAEMPLRRELALDRADQADCEEDRADDDVETVEAGRHEEGRRIDAILEAERGVRILVGLAAGEGDAEQNGQRQAV